MDSSNERERSISRRPRRLPEWPCNLFAMVHARSHDVLYSTRILKKTGLRLG